MERSERDQLGSRRSTKLTVSQSSDARSLRFVAEIVKLCLQHDFVAQANLRQLVLVVFRVHFGRVISARAVAVCTQLVSARVVD